MIFDLHCHTKCSDGVLSPQQLVDRAVEMGVDVLSITDHDTAAAIPIAQEHAKHLSIQIISGIEFSSVWNGMGIHVVGLNFDINSPVMIAAIEQQTLARNERAEIIAQKMAAKGFDNLLEQALKLADGGQVGRPHFAMAMVESGKVKNIAQAFKKHLGQGKPGDVKAQWPELAKVIQWIRDSGGVPVLAHPDKYNLTRTKMKLLLTSFVEAGGQAIEVVTSGIDPSLKQKLADFCIDYNLMASQGSDFHGPKPWTELGKLSPMPEVVTPVWQSWS